MLVQRRIDEYYQVTRTLTQISNKVSQNFELSSTINNNKKRKSIKQISSAKKNVKVTTVSKRTIKHSKSNNSYFHNDNGVEPVSQNNILNDKKLYINVKDNVEEDVLSQINKSTSESASIFSDINNFHFDDDENVEIVFQNNSILNNEESHINIEENILSSQINKAIPECTIIYEKVNESKSSYLSGINRPYEIIHEDLDRVSFINEPQHSILANTMPTSDNDISLTKKKDSPVKKSNTYTPKKFKYPPEASSSKSPKKIKGERLLDCFMDTGIIDKVIEHMNLTKQGVIAPNDFNLEGIYSKDTFKYSYNKTNTKDSVQYELSNVNLCNDLYATILIGSILTVLSSPLNCGYFERGELDFIYSILTLPIKAQMLLARMIKRKRGWHRKSDIKYLEISANLKDIFDLLESKSICTFDIRNNDLHVILKLLHTDELRQVCKSVKIDSKGNKGIIIDKLLQLSKQKPLFPGMKSPINSLYDCIFNVLDYCVRITDKTWNIMDTILTLLLPNVNPIMTIADIYYKLSDIYLGKVIYPTTPKNHFPIFSSRIHLLSYINVKSTLSMTLQLIENKKWVDVQMIGNSAMESLQKTLASEFLRLKNSKIPMHVRRFMPGYIWLKILSKSIDAYKKCKNMTCAIEILNALLKQDCHMHARKGTWYCELALIKMVHEKDVESAALIIMKALDTEHLSQIDIKNLVERAKKILKKKGIKSDTKTSINKVIDKYQMPKFNLAYNTIYAPTNRSIKNAPGSKSIWCIENNSTGESYGSVEALALHYYTQQNFSNGLHCEGNLPILLFATLFWEELYNKDISGTFMSLYEDAPADLYTEDFHKNRENDINNKLKLILKNHTAESLGCWMENTFNTYFPYQSLIPKNLLQRSGHLKEIVHCLGIQGVIGICRRMSENYKLWSAGFPDLIVWNYDTKQHKIVEVKGPNDVLSTKQELWLEYLNKLGLNTEVCLVRGRKSIQR